MSNKRIEEIKEEFKARITRKADYILKEVLMVYYDIEENDGCVNDQLEFMKIALDIVNEKLVDPLKIEG